MLNRTRPSQGKQFERLSELRDMQVAIHTVGPDTARPNFICELLATLQSEYLARVEFDSAPNFVKGHRKSYLRNRG